MKPLNQSTANRIMLAASEVETTNHREAAVLGGIVVSLVDQRRFDVRYIQHHTTAALEWARRMEMQFPQTFRQGGVPDASMPTEDEIKGVAKRFRDKYQGPPEQLAANAA